MRIQKHSGWMMEWTAYLHTVIGLILYWKPIRDIGLAGVWNGVERAHDRSMAFWFIMFGVLMWVLGQLMKWVTHKQRLALPASVGWSITVLCVIGVICIPVSGFWIAIPQGLYIVWLACKPGSPISA